MKNPFSKKSDLSQQASPYDRDIEYGVHVDKDGKLEHRDQANRRWIMFIENIEVIDEPNKPVSVKILEGAHAHRINERIAGLNYLLITSLPYGRAGGDNRFGKLWVDWQIIMKYWRWIWNLSFHKEFRKELQQSIDLVQQMLPQATEELQRMLKVHLSQLIKTANQIDPTSLYFQLVEFGEANIIPYGYMILGVTYHDEDVSSRHVNVIHSMPNPMMGQMGGSGEYDEKYAAAWRDIAEQAEMTE